MENKICPLMSTGKEIPEGCQEACCAWWVSPVPNGPDGHCAVCDLYALPRIAKAVRSI